MINYFKYTSGNAFTLSGVDYSGFVNINDNKPYTGRTKNSFSVELSSKDNFLSRSLLEKREFDNSPTAFTTNKLNSLEYSPRNVLSNDFLKKNFNILYKNNLSLFSLGQVYNNSYLDTSNFKDEQTLGGFFGLSSTTIDDRDDDNKTHKDLDTSYHIDPFKGADKNRFPDLCELDNTKRSYIETYEDGFVYTITTNSKTIAFSGNFTGEIEKIRNSTIQNALANVKRLDVDKANGLIYSPTIESDGLNYTNIYDRDIYRACTRLKLVDKIKTSNFRVINNNISFGKNYKVVQVIDDEFNINLEISPNNTSEILATIPISSLNNPEYVKVESRFTDDLLLIVTKPVSNTSIYNIYFIDIPEFLLNKEIPVPKVIDRVILNSKYKSPTNKDSAVTVFGTVNETTGYYYPLFVDRSAVSEFSLTTPREITFPEVPGKVFYYAADYLNFNPPLKVNGEENRPDGLFIYRNDNSIINLDVSFSDYDSNLFTIKDNGNVTERMVTNPVPVTSFLDPADLLLPPDILFNSPYKFNTNSWKFNTNRLESNRVAFIDTHTDTFKEKTYVYYHNVGRIFFSSDSLNKKRISLVPADLQSFFNPDIFDTICETSLGINLNVLIQDILRDTINIYNNFTRIPTVGELKSFFASGADEYVVQNPTQQANTGSVTSRVETLPWEPPSDEARRQTKFGFSGDSGSRNYGPDNRARLSTITTTGRGPYKIILGPDIFNFDLENYQGITDSIEVTLEVFNEFKSLPEALMLDKYFDIIGRVETRKYYINEKEVSLREYEEFQNLSREEQLNRYGDPEPQVVVNQLVSSRVESTSVKVFDDYKIPTPLEIDTRNFYFHSNESVNYLSINRVFSKLFELQKTIYDSILSS